MIPKRPYFYTPDEYFEFGLAGEHPVEFTCWIGDEEPGYKLPVRIHRVVIKFTFKDPCRQEVDITERIRKDSYLMERYEDEIRADFLAKREKDWEREGA